MAVGFAWKNKAKDGDDKFKRWRWGSRDDVSIARGGPIYVPNLVGPLTRVPDFESALFYELEDLKDELCLHAISPSNDDNICMIDELKIYSDEDLVEMALKETLNESCFAKVDEVLKIKQKQDQDKATVSCIHLMLVTALDGELQLRCGQRLEKPCDVLGDMEQINGLGFAIPILDNASNKGIEKSTVHSQKPIPDALNKGLIV
ncbi:hypothetical protein GH714_039512 [Hevea brasiliensis]|uniref:Uncharacterized protein n=1 Tax=Hevea brasiliensis TaxID=3981 RepID=A0A6A6MG47_HEVBR|nr:hypothetical protein GH714_039512 [Hevea brasiliensis]